MRAAVAETVGSLGWANVASSTTTAAGFLVVALSSLNVVQQLGVLTAAGMFITIGEFFILYPALAFLLLRRGAPLPSPPDTPRLGRWAAASRRHARAVRIGVLAVAALGALAASRVRARSDAASAAAGRLAGAARAGGARRALHALGAGRGGAGRWSRHRVGAGRRRTAWRRACAATATTA